MLRVALSPLLGALLALGACSMLTGASDLRTEPARGVNGGDSSGSPHEAGPDSGTSELDGGRGDDAMASSRICEITFESGSVTGTNGGKTATGKPLVTTEGALRGTYSMVVGSPTAYVETTFTDQDEIYASFAFSIAMFPDVGATATIARIGFSKSTGTLDFVVSAGGLLASINGSSSSMGSAVKIGSAYRVGVHLRQASGKLTIDFFVAEGATSAFGTDGSHIVTGSPGAVDRIAFGSIGPQPLTAIFDQLLVDTFAMPTP